MKKRGRRILSIILTAVMVFALLPVISMPIVVKADDVPQEHQAHDEKDDENDNCKYHKGWKAIHNWDELKSLGEDGGSGYLVDNIEISETFTIKSGKTVNLCLNGYSITQTADYDTITVYGTFNLYDQSKKPGKITHAKAKTGSGVKIEYNGTFTMTEGTISGNNASHGCGVYNIETFTMEGGTISENKALSDGNDFHGGGVYNKGTFTMNRGTISENEVEYGGGVFNTKTFTMNGGTISGNETDIGIGGGVENDGTFEMGHGDISNNQAVYGGGVYNYNNGTFTMTEGTISENKARIFGGGVDNFATFTMEGGAIKENKAEKKGAGVYVEKTFIKENGNIEDSIEGIEGVCTVTFNANGGSNKTIIQYVLTNMTTNLAPNKFSYDNHKFVCWNTKADCTGVPYQDEEKTIINSNLVLYARWIESYDVTFKVNNGSWSDGETDDVKKNYWKYSDEDKTLVLNASDIPKPGNPAKGYKTGNWDAEPDTVNALSENIEYTYTFAPIEYTVKFDANGGAGTMDNQGRKYDDETALTANAFTLEGYTFKGWNTAADGSGTSYADKNDSNLSSTDGETICTVASE